MSEYQLTATDASVIYTDPNDGTVWTVPNAPGNRHWDEYQVWLSEGGVPDPYVEPPPPPPAPPTPEQQVLFDHENRIRTQEGQPPLTAADFATKMSKK